MATFERIFVITDVATTHRLFDQVITEVGLATREQRRIGGPQAAAFAAMERQVLVAYENFNRGLEETARLTAAKAKVAMLAKLRATAKRPDNGRGPKIGHLLDAYPLDLGPLATGVVGIAPHDKLDQAPWWRTQESGYAGNVGRRLRGFYFDAGGGGRGRVPAGLSGPLAGLAGQAIGYAPSQGMFRQHPIFETGPGPAMTITRPIVARHFIRDGANAARTEWRRGIRSVQAKAVRDLARVGLEP
jgi:hypothetical protein